MCMCKCGCVQCMLEIEQVMKADKLKILRKSSGVLSWQKDCGSDNKNMVLR